MRAGWLPALDEERRGALPQRLARPCPSRSPRPPCVATGAAGSDQGGGRSGRGAPSESWTVNGAVFGPSDGHARAGDRARHCETSDQRAADFPAWMHIYNWHRPHAVLGSRPPISRLRMDRDRGHRGSAAKALRRSASPPGEQAASRNDLPSHPIAPAWGRPPARKAPAKDRGCERLSTGRPRRNPPRRSRRHWSRRQRAATARSRPRHPRSPPARNHQRTARGRGRTGRRHRRWVL